MQPAVLVRVGVRFVAGVDDRPLERGLETDLDLEEVGPLAELEAVLAAVLPDADPACADDDLPETKNGVRCRTMSAKGVARAIR